MPDEGSLPPPSAPPTPPTPNFYSIQINPLFAPPIFQLEENKALLFFYSIQMSGLKSPTTNHQSPNHGEFRDLSHQTIRQFYAGAAAVRGIDRRGRHRRHAAGV